MKRWCFLSKQPVDVSEQNPGTAFPLGRGLELKLGEERRLNTFKMHPLCCVLNGGPPNASVEGSTPSVLYLEAAL